MSHQRKLKKFNSVMPFIMLVLSAVSLVVAIQSKIRAEESLRHANELLSQIDSPNKDASMDPFAQGNAPFGGGLNAESGPGYFDPSPLYPPTEKRINPAPPSGDGVDSMRCSDPTGWGDGYHNVTVPFTVPEGWSVWECIKEHFPDRGEFFYDYTIDFLQARINEDPTSEVYDVNVVPVGYRFIMGGDGAGPYPATAIAK